MAPSAEKPRTAGAGTAPTVERFLGEPTRDLADWRWLWDGDHRFPLQSHRERGGRLVVFVKRWLQRLLAHSQTDLWERQRIFNLISLEFLQRSEDIRRVVLETHAARMDHLECVWREGLSEIMAHNDALFARVDQKLDRVRRESRDLWSRLASALAVAEQGGREALSQARAEHVEIELERRSRGTEKEISARLAPYVVRFQGKGEVLDLACGGGEALALFANASIPARGVDASAAMVEECRRKGLEADCADLFDALAATAAGSLGGVVAIQIVEQMPVEALDRLVRLAWRALAPGGVLLLETPNPLSIVVAARNFWIDPAHRRPVHPTTLELIYRQAGFDLVERLEVRPFGAAETLPEIPLGEIEPELRPVAHRVNELRDALDDLLFGYQDYALVGTKPDK